MKALTIRQPWAWAIMSGLKIIENRTWKTPYRGELLIHAGRGASVKLPGNKLPDGTPIPDDLPRGFALGVVDLIDILPVEECDPDNPFAIGPWCWVLSRPRPLASPIACKGALSLWRPPAAVLEAARHAAG